MGNLGIDTLRAFHFPKCVIPSGIHLDLRTHDQPSLMTKSFLGSVKKILPPPSGKDFDDAVKFLAWIKDLKNFRGSLRQQIYASLKQPDRFK